MILGAHIEHFAGQQAVITHTMNPIPSGGIAGWNLLFIVKDQRGITIPGLIATTPGGGGAIPITITDPTNGVSQWTIPRSATLALAPGEYQFDVWRNDPGSEEPLTIGDYLVKPTVSKGVAA